MPTALAKRVFGDTSFGKWIPFLRAKINQMAMMATRDGILDGMAMGKAMATHEQCATMFPQSEGVRLSVTFRFQLRSKVLGYKHYKPVIIPSNPIISR